MYDEKYELQRQLTGKIHVMCHCVYKLNNKPDYLWGYYEKELIYKRLKTIKSELIKLRFNVEKLIKEYDYSCFRI